MSNYKKLMRRVRKFAADMEQVNSVRPGELKKIEQ